MLECPISVAKVEAPVLGVSNHNLVGKLLRGVGVLVVAVPPAAVFEAPVGVVEPEPPVAVGHAATRHGGKEQHRQCFCQRT